MRILLIASLFVLSGCSTVEGWFGNDKPAPKAAATTAAAPSGEKVVITKATWAAFENYKYWLTPIVWNKPMGQGYFAVAQDGRSWGLERLPGQQLRRRPRRSVQDAINICETKQRRRALLGLRQGSGGRRSLRNRRLSASLQ